MDVRTTQLNQTRYKRSLPEELLNTSPRLDYIENKVVDVLTRAAPTVVGQTPNDILFHYLSGGEFLNWRSI